MNTLNKLVNILTWHKNRFDKLGLCMIVGLDAHGKICFRDFGCKDIFVLSATQIYKSKALLTMFDDCDQHTIIQMVLNEA